ncbi:MAG: peptide chain release factor-like protein [Candidatus Paceibacterota bacterium]
MTKEHGFNQLDGKYDKGGAHITIHPGAGGDDAKDFSNMLFDMYVAYCQKKGFKVAHPDEGVIEVRGDYAYGKLKGEAGVHRLVRISPFDSKKLRHTSFALVEIIPVFPHLELQKLAIPEGDLRVDTARSSGPGGQNVNKRDTAVRITHLPTGLAAASQNERSQLANKEKALSLLKAKIFHLLEKHQESEISSLKTHAKPEWGSQIRSYVLHPYKKVKDHRTGVQSNKPDQVLEGDLDLFIEAETDKE